MYRGPIAGQSRGNQVGQCGQSQDTKVRNDAEAGKAGRAFSVMLKEFQGLWEHAEGLGAEWRDAGAGIVYLIHIF